jgi:hypothetical protein
MKRRAIGIRDLTRREFLKQTAELSAAGGLAVAFGLILICIGWLHGFRWHSSLTFIAWMNGPHATYVPALKGDGEKCLAIFRQASLEYFRMHAQKSVSGGIYTVHDVDLQPIADRTVSRMRHGWSCRPPDGIPMLRSRIFRSKSSPPKKPVWRFFSAVGQLKVLRKRCNALDHCQSSTY